MNRSHGGRVGEVALFFCALPVEDFNRIKISLFPFGGRLGASLCVSRAQATQGGARGSRFLREPYRLVVGHGLTPVRHREIGSQRTRGDKLLSRIEVFKAVKKEDTACKSLLRFGRAGNGKDDAAETSGLRVKAVTETKIEYQRSRVRSSGHHDRSSTLSSHGRMLRHLERHGFRK